MRVLLLLLRPNAVVQTGGDLIQLKSIAENLNRISNFEVITEIWSVDWTPQNVDLVIVYNEKPLLLFDTLRKAKFQDIKVALAPIHHRDSDMIRIFSEKSKAIKLLSNLKPKSIGSSVDSTLVHVLYLLSDFSSIKKIYGSRLAVTKLWEARALFLSRKKLREYLDDLVFISFLSEIEKVNFERDYRYSTKNAIVVPNGISQNFETNLTPWQNREKDIAVIGRVEIRKGQLAIAEHSRLKNLRIDFIGAKNPNHEQYFAEFIELLNRNENFEYLGEMPHEKIASALQNYKVLLLNSHAEVLSLVELEAASMGLYIVTTPSGGSKEYIEDCQLYEYEFGDLDNAAEICEILIHKNQAPASLTKVMTWMEVAKIYALSIEKFLG